MLADVKKKRGVFFFFRLSFGQFVILRNLSTEFSVTACRYFVHFCVNYEARIITVNMAMAAAVVAATAYSVCRARSVEILGNSIIVLCE